MDKGMKKILVILGIFGLVSLISAVKFFQIERVTYRQYLKVESENVKLNERVSSLSQERLKLANKLETASKELKEISRKEEQLKEKYNSLIAENRQLNIQVEMLSQEKGELENEISAVESDDFLAQLLKSKVSLEVKVKNLEEKLKKTKNLEGETEVITKAKLELEEQLAQEKEVSEKLSRDFLQGKQEKLTALSRVESIKGEKKYLKVALDRATDEKISLEKELVNVREELGVSKDERERLTAQIADMESILKDRLAEVNLVRSKLERMVRKSKPKTKEVVELPPIVVKAETYSSSLQTPPRRDTVPPQVTQAEQLTGKIMTINEEYRFIVIDLGSDDGLEAGMFFGVYRDNKEIARIKVVETRRQIAAADIVSLDGRTEIKPGDAIKSR